MGVEGVHDFRRLCLCRCSASLDAGTARRTYRNRLWRVFDGLDELKGLLSAKKGTK